VRTAVFALVALLAAALAATGLFADGGMSVAGTSWRPVALSGFSGTDERPVLIEFENAEKVSGFAGCNSYFGSYEHKGDKLSLGPLATTRKACPGDIMNRETDFLKLLEQARLAEVTAGELILKTLEGAVLLRLTPHP
jgi:heat shock protein HslJ